MRCPPPHHTHACIHTHVQTIKYENGHLEKHVPPSRVQPLSTGHIKGDYVHGERVRANWQSCGTWCLGRICAVNHPEGTFNVQYDDGEVELHVAAHSLQPAEDAEFKASGQQPTALATRTDARAAHERARAHTCTRRAHAPAYAYAAHAPAHGPHAHAQSPAGRMPSLRLPTARRFTRRGSARRFPLAVVDVALPSDLADAEPLPFACTLVSKSSGFGMSSAADAAASHGVM